jgi:hypothetical protein
MTRVTDSRIKLATNFILQPHVSIYKKLASLFCILLLGFFMYFLNTALVTVLSLLYSFVAMTFNGFGTLGVIVGIGLAALNFFQYQSRQN